MEYKAEDTRLGRFVALKFLPPEGQRDAHAQARFQREAQAASALNHHNICTVYDIGEQDGQTFIAMELLEGQTLRQKIGSRPLPLETLLDYAIQTAAALEIAHKNGIVHRDIKPSNRTAYGLFQNSLSRDGNGMFVVGRLAQGSLDAYDKKEKRFLPYLGGVPAMQLAVSPDRKWMVYTD